MFFKMGITLVSSSEDADEATKADAQAKYKSK